MESTVVNAQQISYLFGSYGMGFTGLVAGRLTATVVAGAVLLVATGCREAQPALRRSATPIVVAPESPTPTVRTITSTTPIEVSGRETKWRLYLSFVDRPRDLPRLKLTPTPEGAREQAEGQFVVVAMNIENIGNAVPTVSVDLGDAVVLTDGSGREYRPLRGASASYTLTMPGAPGNPYDARLQPNRGIPYAFVFDVPANATGLQFSGQGAPGKVALP
jgi:hypothetical protein